MDSRGVAALAALLMGATLWWMGHSLATYREENTRLHREKAVLHDDLAYERTLRRASDQEVLLWKSRLQALSGAHMQKQEQLHDLLTEDAVACEFGNITVPDSIVELLREQGSCKPPSSPSGATGGLSGGSSRPSPYGQQGVGPDKKQSGAAPDR